MNEIRGFTVYTKRSGDILPPRVANDVYKLLDGYSKRYSGDRFNTLLELFRQHVFATGHDAHGNLSDFDGPVLESFLGELYARYVKITETPLEESDFNLKYGKNYPLLLELMTRLLMNTWSYIVTEGSSPVTDYYRGDILPDELTTRSPIFTIDQSNIDELTRYSQDTNTYFPIPVEQAFYCGTFVFKIRNIVRSSLGISDRRITLHLSTNELSTINVTPTGFTFYHEASQPPILFSEVQGRDWVNCIFTFKPGSCTFHYLDMENNYVTVALENNASGFYRKHDTLQIHHPLDRDRVHLTNSGIREIGLYGEILDTNLINMILHEK